MPSANAADAAARQAIEEVYKNDSRRILATLIRLLGDFDAAEEALQDALAAALQQWPKEGVPSNPRAWLISTGRFKAIDAIRRRSRFDHSIAQLADKIDDGQVDLEHIDGVADDDLRLIFTCCHPALQPDARVALTLREVCGLTTEEIARAFLTSAPTVAQRIVRAKAKIRDAGIPYQVPSGADLPERLDTVLQVIYLVFNEGYSASFGDSLTRADISGEAIRLGRLIASLIPSAEVFGLLALMLLQESRRHARTSSDGDIVLLENQDRTLWNRAFIAEGAALVERALQLPDYGPYTIQAAIAAVHAQAAKPEDTDWQQIVGLYDVLLQFTPSPVIELNRAVALAMATSPEAALPIIENLLNDKELSAYHLAHSAHADLCRRLGRMDKAKQSYEKALALAQQEPEKRFLQRRLAEIG